MLTPVIPSRRRGARRLVPMWRGRSDVGHLACTPPPAGDWRPCATWREWGGGGDYAAVGMRAPVPTNSGPDARVGSVHNHDRRQRTCRYPAPAARTAGHPDPACAHGCRAPAAARQDWRGGEARAARNPFPGSSPRSDTWRLCTFRPTPAHAAPCATYEAPLGAQGERLSDVIRSWAGPGRSSQPFLAGPPRGAASGA